MTGRSKRQELRFVSFMETVSISGSLIAQRTCELRLVYFDEAGISNPTQEPFLVVAGILLDADQDWLALDRHLKSIMRKRLPEEMRFTGIFHAKDIWHGTKNFHRDQWPMSKRMEILADLAAIPARFHLLVIHGFVHRIPAAAFLKERQPNLPDATVANLIHASAFLSVAAAVDKWMRQNAPNEVAMLVAEDTGKVKETLRLFHEGYRQDYVDSFFDEIAVKGFPKNVFKTRNIIDAVHFARKLESPLLQIVDTCAFLIKRQLQGRVESKTYFGAFERQMFVPLTKGGWPVGKIS